MNKNERKKYIYNKNKTKIIENKKRTQKKNKKIKKIPKLPKTKQKFEKYQKRPKKKEQKKTKKDHKKEPKRPKTNNKKYQTIKRKVIGYNTLFVTKTVLVEKYHNFIYQTI